jgi:hypothetical protein
MARNRQPEWAERKAGRRRVLIENPDMGAGFAAERVLQDAGYEVAVCGGPDRLPDHECPLVHDGRCGLSEGADAIVHSLNLDRPEHAAVLRALRDRLPDVPIVVEVPAPAMVRHEALLSTCRVLPAPATRVSLTDAVQSVLPGT